MDWADKGLYAHFHRLRVLGGAVAVAAGIGAIMLALQGDGVTIESFLQTDKSDDDVKGLMDNYNSISGNISSFISKPVERGYRLRGTAQCDDSRRVRFSIAHVAH